MDSLLASLLQDSKLVMPIGQGCIALRQDPHFACRIGLTLTPPPAPPLSLAAKRWGKGGAQSRLRASGVDFALERKKGFAEGVLSAPPLLALEEAL